MNQLKISPSILSADFTRLAEQVREAEEAGVDYIHVDVMDGHFVPNITIGPLIVKALRPVTKLPFDVHLMISPVNNFIKDFAEAGADIITIHPEATDNLMDSIQKIKSYDNDKQRIYAIQIQACESNIKVHKEHIRKLEEKIKTM